jgi:hypothetical protein
VGLSFAFVMDDSASDILFLLSLCAAFPIFLLGFVSLRVAVIALWSFTLFRWIDHSFTTGAFLSPFEGWPGVCLLIGVILVHVGYVFLARGPQSVWSVRLWDEPDSLDVRRLKN